MQIIKNEEVTSNDKKSIGRFSLCPGKPKRTCPPVRRFSPRRVSITEYDTLEGDMQ
jgi:hypothetical protein